VLVSFDTKFRIGGCGAPDAFGAYHKAEIEKGWPIIKGANIKNE
jgi:hypothetical protein